MFKFSRLSFILFLFCSTVIRAQNYDFTLSNLYDVGGGVFSMGKQNDVNLGVEVQMSSYRIAKFKTTNHEFLQFLNDISANAQYQKYEYPSSLRGSYRDRGEMLVVSYKGIDIICVIADSNENSYTSSKSKGLRYPEFCSQIKYNFGVQKGGKFYLDPFFEMYPVVGVTWTGAELYCEWLSKKTGRTFKIQTEAQWEYANQEHGDGIQHLTNETSPRLPNQPIHPPYSGYNDDSPKLGIVGQERPYLSVQDMNDMCYEYCYDFYNSKLSVSHLERDPKGPLSGAYKVIRLNGKRLPVFIEHPSFSVKENSDYRNYNSTRQNQGIYTGYISFRIVEEI